MKFCDERIQNHLLNGGKIVYSGIEYPLFLCSSTICFKDDNGKKHGYSISKYDLTNDDWEIVEPEYNWDKIIKDKILCVFSQQENFEYKTISTVSEKYEDNDGYFTSQGMRYKYCKPFNPADFNIAKNLKEYEK